MPVTYAMAAAAGYDALATQYVTCAQGTAFADNFWHGATALQTCLDYVVRNNQKQDLKGILVTGEAVFTAFVSAKDWWRDDYAWWGNAFMSAWLNRTQLGYGAAQHDALFKHLLAHSLDCWARVHATWSDKPYGPGDHADDAAAALSGGVCNVPPGGQTNSMSGRNSVTNEGYWLLCQALEKVVPAFGPFARRMTLWYAEWLSQRQGGLLDARRALVRERPGGNEFGPNWCWTGDQGLLFRALMNAGDTQTAHVIANAAMAHLTDGAGILHEDANMPGIIDDYFADYATGKGVLLRNLVAPGASAPPLVARFVQANAAAVWLNRLDDTTNQFAYDWSLGTKGVQVPGGDDGKIVMQAAGQDALNAALLISPGADIPGT